MFFASPLVFNGSYLRSQELFLALDVSGDGEVNQRELLGSGAACCFVCLFGFLRVQNG